jgi:hypothetical protein
MFRASKRPRKFRTQKTKKKTAKIKTVTAKIKFICEPIGRGGWPRRSTLNTRVQAKEGRNVELKNIVTHNLGDGVRSIAEWTKLPMGSCKVFFV